MTAGSPVKSSLSFRIEKTLNTHFSWVESCFTTQTTPSVPARWCREFQWNWSLLYILHSERTCLAYPTSPRYRKSQWRAIVYISHKEVWYTARKTKNCVTSLLYLTKQLRTTEFKNSDSVTKSFKSSANHF